MRFNEPAQAKLMFHVYVFIFSSLRPLIRCVVFIVIYVVLFKLDQKFMQFFKTILPHVSFYCIPKVNILEKKQTQHPL